MPQEDDEAAEMDKAQEILRLALEPSRDAPEPEQPGKEALHLPTPPIPAQWPAVLFASFVVRAHRSDQLDLLLGERRLELRTVVGPVADEPLRPAFGEAGFEGSFNEGDFVTLT